MKNIYKPAFACGIACIVLAILLFLWMYSSAMARCTVCDCSYRLTAENSYCRLPAMLEIFAYAAFLTGVTTLALSLGGVRTLIRPRPPRAQTMRH